MEKLLTQDTIDITDQISETSDFIITGYLKLFKGGKAAAETDFHHRDSKNTEKDNAIEPQRRTECKAYITKSYTWGDSHEYLLFLSVFSASPR